MNSCSSLPRIFCAQTIQPMMNDMSLHPYPKGAPIGRQISIPPFDMTSHPLTSLPGTHTNRISAEKCSRSRSHPWSKDIQRRPRLPEHKVDDKASSKTHLVRFMHNVVTPKFKIFSVAKTRCRNTRLSPKTPKVFPVLNSSSKIRFLG